ncbi:uncharacterized protein L201_001877 [Kwoniella dendrophila CBS 6074]|uniref:PUB domain-containing protein n=1 Tax=Kwoniella dendrophila CBS 6074 TaxID=1295534 RepID=A0AAX4JNK0_9TREE
MASTSNNPVERRAAALAAIEARFRPPPSYDEIQDQTEPSATLSSTTTPDPSSSNTPRLSPPPAIRQTPAAQAGQARANALANSSSRSQDQNWRPTEKEDREIRIKFMRLLDRGIVRDNNYANSADAVETLLKISNNILTSNETKYRTIKASNSTIKNKVLDVKGGHDYLIALGFRTQTVDFTLNYMFSATIKKMHELQIGADVLQEHLKSLQERVELSKQSKIYGATVEAARKATALADIEADREAVRNRAIRERINREAREAKEREDKERETQNQAEMLVDRDDEERREMRDAVIRPQIPATTATPAGNQTEDQEEENEEREEEEEEEDSELPTYMEDRESRNWGGPGRRLGG